MGAYTMNFGSMNESVDIDAIMESTEIEACFEESSLDAALKVVSESTQNWNAIIEACSIDELNFLEENSTEMVYEGAKLDGFISKAKEFFLNVWKKIQSIFKKALMQFNSWFQTDKEFLKKYQKDLNKSNNSGFGDKTVKWFNYVYYTNADLSSEFTGAVADTTGTIELASAAKEALGSAPSSVEDWKKANQNMNSEYKQKIYNKCRAAFIGKDSEVEAGEFVKLLKEKLQGGESKDDVKLSTALSTATSFLSKSEGIKKHISKELDVDKKSIDAAIKALDAIKKDLSKDSGSSTGKEIEGAKHSVAVSQIEILKGCKNILITANGIDLSCLKSASRQAKSICVAAVSYKTPKNEGAMMQHESGMSLLDNVTMV